MNHPKDGQKPTSYQALFDDFVYGGDYNPEQWPSAVWEEDMELFAEAGICSATINVFSWPFLQQGPEQYDFSLLDRIFDRLEAAGLKVVLGTATAALPAWLSKLEPGVHRVDWEGRRHRFSHRHNFCPTSSAYRHYAGALVEKIAARYSQRPSLICWHINNEYGGYCYCPDCEKAFQAWVKTRYGTLEAVNQAWNMSFWGHLLTDWDEIVVPNALGEGMWDQRSAFAGISLDYMRFQSEQLLSLYRLERDKIRQYDPDTLITTNLMGLFKDLDYFAWAKEMDVISYDNYPARTTPPWANAFLHELMRSLKQGKPYMLMEQSPSQVNWQPWNAQKRPGQMRQISYQALGNGADTIQFFQLRQSRGACEKFHAAVIAHAGHGQTRQFQEIKELGQELPILQASGLLGSRVETKVGILMSWENFWALELMAGPTKDLKYQEQLLHYYEGLRRLGLNVDFLEPGSDLTLYRFLIAPSLYMIREEEAKALEDWVATGGHLLLTYMSGVVDPNDNVWLGGYPGPLRKLAGIWVEEVDGLTPEERNAFVLTEAGEKALVSTLASSSPHTFTCRLLCERVHPEGAEVLATYQREYYQGEPCWTRHAWGEGYCDYMASMVDKDLLEQLYQAILSQLGVKTFAELPEGLELTERHNEQWTYRFLSNPQATASTYPLSLQPEQGECLVGVRPGVEDPGEGQLEAYGVRIYRYPRQA